MAEMVQNEWPSDFPMTAESSEDCDPVSKEEVPIPAKYTINRDDLEYHDKKDLLGEGGFGSVYKAKMKNSGDVAVKVIRGRKNDAEMKHRNKEARILLGIEKHPHIIGFLGVCQGLRFYGLVMKLMDGGDLHELLASENPKVANWGNRVDICRQVALGMNHLHCNSPPVIHRDLKSKNVLFEHGQPFICKICDFGFSKMSGVSTLSEDRKDGSTPAGTVAFIAPERYYCSNSKDDKREIAKKSDVFSYGVLLWEIRERDLPFRGMKRDDISQHIKTGIRLPMGSQKAPVYFNELLEDCTTFEPKKRPSFADVITRLTTAKKKLS
eukprot:m.216193 g.216193  ORF g.216193 m.216193 type:complete len:324 (+) comp39854_c0_seq5:141-1112(+)